MSLNDVGKGNIITSPIFDELLGSEELDGGMWNVKCIGCGDTVDTVTTDDLHDLIVYLASNNITVYCFDCETDIVGNPPCSNRGVSLSPSMVEDWENDY